MKIITPLNSEEIDRLEAQLKAYDGLDMSTLDGFFTAITSAPEVSSPEQWLPIVFQSTQWRDKRFDDFETLYALLIRHLNGIESILSRDAEKFEPLFLERDLHDSVDIIVDNWCRGYMKGVALVAAPWKDEYQTLEAWLSPILMFSGSAGASLREKSSREQILQWKAQVAPSARAIFNFWYDARPKYQPTVTQPFVRHTPKPGRNDQCVCGSGKKFKHCCGAH